MDIDVPTELIYDMRGRRRATRSEIAQVLLTICGEADRLDAYDDRVADVVWRCWPAIIELRDRRDEPLPDSALIDATAKQTAEAVAFDDLVATVSALNGANWTLPPNTTLAELPTVLRQGIDRRLRTLLQRAAQDPPQRRRNGL